MAVNKVVDLRNKGAVDLANVIKEQYEANENFRAFYLEAMAAAYFNETDIDPQLVTLVEMDTPNGRVFFFDLRSKYEGGN